MYLVSNRNIVKQMKRTCLTKVSCAISHPYHSKAKNGGCHKRDHSKSPPKREGKVRRSILSRVCYVLWYKGNFQIMIQEATRRYQARQAQASQSILNERDNAPPTDIESFHSTFCQMGSVSVYGTSIQRCLARNMGKPWVTRKSSSSARHTRPILLTRRVVSKISFG
jgi:hypothetical protein